ncbi:MAG: hypothetical protein HY246_02970, partial [Proteobacteria bacterium]|nr:hypothetical protein [Pseudomonadota bacterium]
MTIPAVATRPAWTGYALPAVAGLLPPLGVVAPNGATPLLLVAALAAIIATPWQALLRNLPRVFAAG